ncbi:MAG: glycerophosphoryl diester phosphodiesterase [Muribaculaceae bacterium]|nr:glycerophosphoryl diester phosphodiesterase [Muribaculaceae bacterium]
MTTRIKSIAVCAAVAAVGLLQGTDCAARTVALKGKNLTIEWRRSGSEWHLSKVKAGGALARLPKSEHTVLYSVDKPSEEPLAPAAFGGEEGFPGDEYRYVLPSWREATTAVALNRAGEACHYIPQDAVQLSDSLVRLSYTGPGFSVSEDWMLAPDGDVHVKARLTAARHGWYSLATPSLCAVKPSDLDFALIPGVLHGHAVGTDFCRDYAYGRDIPSEPVLFRERSTSTLSSMITDRAGLTVAVTAEPGTAEGPWGREKRNTGLWQLGLSAMNRSRELSPTLYHPVLGQADSEMEPGQVREFSFRYTLARTPWWPVFNHVANDIYRFHDALALRENKRSLTDRLYGIHRYVVADSTSLWHTVDCDGTLIGAQEYLGGVYKAKKDAMKNADYGAMWMLGAMTGDSLITECRLPYALNFKRCQQYADGPMKGASRGQYYLRDSHIFVEEWGPYTEPIATTYYMLMDLGNIALFEPEANELKTLIRNAADWLLSMQKADGSWEVAYNDATGEAAFADLRDLRPTFYGLLIAYRILGDEKYLAAARRGADWLIANAVEPHRWLGVCGDTRFAPDFATIQAAQALLELHDLTADSRYLDAAVATARFYTTSVYTNPIADTTPRKVKGRTLADWQISQSGLSYEHGGIIGSTNLHGPILLASHAGLFVRMYGLTSDRIFLDMARAAAIGRDAFVDHDTAVASYYWAAMNRGAGPYPHHAWWQMGWITDYLMAELELRSKGNISFPAGFITPKVGPHRTYAFAPGTVYGESALPVMIPGGISCSNPNVEVVLARGDKHLFVMLLNDLGTRQRAELTADAVALGASADPAYTLELPPYGLELLKIPNK